MYRIRQGTVSKFKTAVFKSTSAVAQADLQELEHAAVMIPFSHAKIGPFFQEHPRLDNQYLQDTTLKSYLRRHIPGKFLSKIEPDLEQFGQRVATDLYELHLQCDREVPQLQPYDAWGNRVDRLITSPAWKKMHDIAAEEGIVSIAYEKKFGEFSRLYQIAKLFLYSPSAGMYTCPLAMTDGAAKIIETIQDKEPWLVDRAFKHLTSRNPSSFWTSGQWMTERRGGSDVARGTETLARRQPDGSYNLHGYKWFSSATDADMTFTLARVMDDEGHTVAGTKGLSLFYLELRDEAGKLNNIQVQRLKDKLGTRQVPTAELLLDGTKAFKVSDEGRGVPAISSMLTLTRLHNTVGAAAAMRRIVNLARDYATRRQAFGNTLNNYPLHLQTLARMEVETRGAMFLALEVARLLGREDVQVASDHEKELLRLLTPLAKLYTGKQALKVISEGLECFGGQGYMEDTGLPVIFRDAQVLTIWEGTTNILSLDVLRAMAKSSGKVLEIFHQDVEAKLAAAASNEALKVSADRVHQAAVNILQFAAKNTSSLEIAARDFSFSLARTYIGALLVEHAASSSGTQQDVYTAQRWCQKDLALVNSQLNDGAYNGSAADANFSLVFDGYPHKSRL